jgi:DNA-binding NtrC family response regulator
VKNQIMTDTDMAGTKTQSILIVDDEEIIRDLLAEVLEDYTVSQASDGREAIDILKERKFDLVITDLRMPNVPGEEVVKYARETYPDIGVIVISAYSSLHTVSQSITNGACAFLSKPFSIKELMQTVETALDEA